MGGRSGPLASDLVGRVREQVAAGASRNRFVDLLEAGDVPRDRLTWLAGEQFRIVGSDQRSFALLAARFPDPPAGELFLSLAQGELQALRLLADFAAELGWGERELRAYEPRPLAQAYPAFLAWSALFGTCSGVALAMLANLEEWGGYCARVAEALVARYDLSEAAVGFFRFFAGPAPGFTEQATSVVAAGLAAGEDPQEAVRAARAAGIADARVLAAISATPRAGFVPADYVTDAYRDEPIPIGHRQVTTQPSLSARMIEALHLESGDHVLEIGTGLGFQTALLARLAASVISIERWPDLADQARRNLARQGLGNAEVLAGDGSRGLPEGAPYDAILVSAAFPQVPAPLAAQLRIGGRLVQPIGPGGREQVVLFERSASGLERRHVLTLARFVRLHGRYGFPSRS